MKDEPVTTVAQGEKPGVQSSTPTKDGLKDLLIVIVNWNTVDLLEKCLASLEVAMDGLSAQIVVVDNASTDGSAEMVKSDFSWVDLIGNQENLGYARANNQALARYAENARYSLLLNPDTEVPPGTLQAMIEFMEKRPKAGIAGCKLVRPDGGLDWACRRGRLTPSMLFYKALYLDRMFPSSRRFGAYNLTYLDENRTCEVGTVVGAFMMIRKDCLAAAGLLDESYFMYGEDIDLCYRAESAGWKVFYAPVGTIVHHKGKAAAKRSYAMIRHWYSSMWKLYRKHIAAGYPVMLNAVVWGGLWFMCVASLVTNSLRVTKRVPSRR